MDSNDHKRFIYKPTREQLALAEQRKAKKEKKQSVQSLRSDAARIIHRPWISLRSSQSTQQDLQRIKVLSWNLAFRNKLLAQCLVRRELFPTSNCLKAGQREHMLHRELLDTEADIMCLQEVDRLGKLLPILEGAGYSHHYAAGAGKKHGCLIAYKKCLYTMVTTRLVDYDDEEIRSDGDSRARRGRSFQTRNIGSMVLLTSNIKKDEGVIVVTTHLFWHPKYTYERARQTGILVREATKFRSELGLDKWPCILGGDFNFPPNDPVYSLMVGDALLPDQEERLESSRVVHASVDPAILGESKSSTEEGDDETVDPDSAITFARPAASADGLLSVPELVELFSRRAQLRSAYDEGLNKYRDLLELPTFGDRVSLAPTRRGRNEPEYTSYTYFWKTVLDYIFVLDPVDRRSSIVGLLSPHRTADLLPGLPKTGVCGSDHVSLAAELLWL